MGPVANHLLPLTFSNVEGRLKGRTPFWCLQASVSLSVVPGPAAVLELGTLVEIQILEPTFNLLNHRLLRWVQQSVFSYTFHLILKHTQVWKSLTGSWPLINKIMDTRGFLEQHFILQFPGCWDAVVGAMTSWVWPSWLPSWKNGCLSSGFAGCEMVMPLALISYIQQF